MTFISKSILTSFLVFGTNFMFSQIGINTITPDTSAALHIVSKPYGQGLLIPRLTQAQRINITKPAKALMVYDVTDNLFYMNLDSATHNWYAINPWQTKATTNSVSAMYTHSTVTNVGIGTNNPTARLDVNGDIKSNATITTNTLIVAGFPNNALVPAGIIVMWSGAITSIPSGWALCDGSGTAPDLRGRFIVSAGTDLNPVVGDLNPTYAVGDVGGENTHILSTAEIPKHSHKVNGDGATVAASGGSHHHGSNPNGQGTNSKRSSGNSGGLASDSQGYVQTSDDTHSHPNGEFSGQTGDGSSSGVNNQPHENRPPYYVLAFIIKLP